MVRERSQTSQTQRARTARAQEDGKGWGSGSSSVCVCCCVCGGRVEGGFAAGEVDKSLESSPCPRLCVRREENRLPLINPTNGRLVLGLLVHPSRCPTRLRERATLGRDTGTWISSGAPATACRDLRGPAQRYRAVTFQPSQTDRRLTDVPAIGLFSPSPNPRLTDGRRRQASVASKAQPVRTQTPRTLTTGPDYPSGILGLSLAPRHFNSNTLPSSSLGSLSDSAQHVNHSSLLLLSYLSQRPKTLVQIPCGSHQISPSTAYTTHTTIPFALLGQRAACQTTTTPRAVPGP